MIQSIATFCYSVFYVLAVASPFMPIFLMWRLASLAALAYSMGRLIEGPVHWSDQNLGYVIGMAILFFFSCTIALVIVIRFAVSTKRKTLSIDTIRGPSNRFMHYFDGASLVAMGCFMGLLAVICLSFALSGITSNINLDLTIAVLASAVATIVLALSRTRVAITITATFATLAVLAFTGSRQTDNILSTAECLADGRAWCLTTSSGSALISNLYQLGFFALPKGNSYPHLGLLIRENDQTALSAHWSIRQQKFDQEINTSSGIPACYPIENFAEALKNGSVKNDTYGVGPNVYSITPEFYPRAFTDRVSIRSNRLIGSNSAHPEITERMELIYNPREPYVPDDAVSIAMIPDPNQLNSDDLSGQNRLIIAGIDDLTEQSLVLYCLQGPYADRLCRAQVFEGSSSYTFFLPLSEIDRWQHATARVKALFESLRSN